MSTKFVSFKSFYLEHCHEYYLCDFYRDSPSSYRVQIELNGASSQAHFDKHGASGRWCLSPGFDLPVDLQEKLSKFIAGLPTNGLSEA